MISRNFGLLGEMLEKEPGCDDDDDGHDNDEENAVGRWYLWKRNLCAMQNACSTQQMESNK